MNARSILLPRVNKSADLLDALADFHESARDIAAWAHTIVGTDGSASPRDARWLRAFLAGPLRWHMRDVETRVLPNVGRKRSDWLQACLERAKAKHEVVVERAAALAELVEPLCSGQRVIADEWQSVTRKFARVVDDAFRFEDDVILPSARLFLSHEERDVIADEIIRDDASRPWATIATAGDVPTIHRVHAVVTAKAPGLQVIRSFADCPRGSATEVETCVRCPHLESIDTDEGGRGHVACAIDDSPARMQGDRVRDHMSRDVRCVEPSATLGDAMRLLAESCVGGAPVVDENGRVVGVLSQSDIIAFSAAAKAGDDIRSHTVAEAMMHVPFVVHESDSIDRAASLILAEGIHRLPVVNGARSVVGIISTLDLLRAASAAGRKAHDVE